MNDKLEKLLQPVFDRTDFGRAPVRAGRLQKGAGEVCSQALTSRAARTRLLYAD
jgi:hypothetical protein